MGIRSLIIVAYCLLLSALNYVFQLSGGSIYEIVVADFGINPAQAGLFFSSIHIIYGVMQFFVIYFVLRFGAIKVLLISLFTMILFLIAATYSTDLTELMLLRICMGFSLSSLFVCGIKLGRSEISVAYFPLFLAAMDVLGMVVLCVGETSIVHWIHVYGWRGFYHYYSEWFAIMAVFLIVYSIYSPEKITTDRTYLQQMNSGLKTAFKDAFLWKNALFSGLIFSIMTVIYGLWLKPFLLVSLGLDVFGSSYYMQVLMFGVICGMLGVVLLLKSSRFIPEICATVAILSGLCLFTLAYASVISIWLLSASLWLLGCCSGCYIVNFLLCDHLNMGIDKNVFIAFSNGICYFVTPTLQSLFGALLSALASNYNPLFGYQVCLMVYGSLFFIGGYLMYVCLSRSFQRNSLLTIN